MKRAPGHPDARPYLRKVLALYSQSPFLSRVYLQIRVRNFPVDAMWPVLLGLRGRVVSIGAGYAIFETAAAMANPAASFLVTDLNRIRVEVGSLAMRNIANVEFGVVDLAHGIPGVRPDIFLLFDILHHLSPNIQEQVLTQIADALQSGGRIIIKECGTHPAWKRWFNRLNDAIGAPFSPTYPQSEEHWASTLNRKGFSTVATRIDRGSPYAHILIEGTKR